MIQGRKPRAIMDEATREKNMKALGFDRQVERKDGLQDIGAKELEELNKIADEITTVVHDTVTTVARARLRIGRLLIDARSKFPGDQEFGKWRQKVLPDMAPRTCLQYMGMAEKFGDAPALLDDIGWSVMAEVMNSPPEVVSKVRDAKPTVAGAREIKKEMGGTNGSAQTSAEKAPPPASTIGPDPASKSPPAKRKSMDQVMDELMQMPCNLRIEAILAGEMEGTDELTQASVIMGFWPDIVEQKPNMGCWLAVMDFNKKELEERAPEHIDLLNQAYSKVRKQWTAY